MSSLSALADEVILVAGLSFFVRKNIANSLCSLV